MNAASIIILAAVAATSVLALIFSIRRTRRGCDHCSVKNCPGRNGGGVKTT